jgi:hypothetical protein
MATSEPTPQEWRQAIEHGNEQVRRAHLFDPAAASPADRSAAEPDITAMRERLREAVNACTDLGMDQAVLILENHRLNRLLREAENRPVMTAYQLREATSLIEYALHLRMHGENAPGGSENWPEFDRKAEDFLRTHGAAAAINATTAKAWADIAYEMWALICNAAHDGHGGAAATAAWSAQKSKLRERFHQALYSLPDSTRLKIENEPSGPHAADHGPGTWTPQPDADGNLTLSEAVGQALGTASMCWHGGTGNLLFDDAQAKRVHEGIMAFLSDWADDIRKKANEATSAKLLAKERWS